MIYRKKKTNLQMHIKYTLDNQLENDNNNNKLSENIKWYKIRKKNIEYKVLYN